MTTQTLRRAPDGPALERWRLALGLSRERLGAAAGGIASATIRRIEHEQVRPQPSTIAAIVGALSARSGAIDYTDERRPAVGPGVSGDFDRASGHTPAL